MESLIDKVLPALLGFLGGIGGSLIAPWASWRVEKRRALMEFRRSQIRRWREFMNTDFEQETFSETTVYSEIRPHLGAEALEAIEGNRIVIRDGRGGNVVKSLVLDDIATLEKKWELI